ncbi:MAG: orotate phosphoribosyltransferase [Desulfurivibrionaceae bacterium]
MDKLKRLKEIILEKSYHQGTFTLTSGRKSDFYIDGKQTTLSAEGAWLCGSLIFERIRKHEANIGAVGGMTLGADPLVTATSIASFLEGAPIPAFIVRKKTKAHGTSAVLEGQDNLAPGCRVTLLEDVVTTGGTLLDVIDQVEAQGFRPAQIITVVDRQEGGAETLAKRGFTLEALFTREELLS